MRANTLFWGIIILVLGVLLLLNTTGVFPVGFNFWGTFGAVLLILVGGWFLLGPVIFRQEVARNMTEEQVSIPLGSAMEADLHIKHGAGEFTIQPLDKPGLLVEGTCVGGVSQLFSQEGDRARLTLSSKVQMFSFPFSIGPRGLNWTLRLTRDIPLRLRLESGAGAYLLRLTDLKVVELRVDTGASGVEIDLPAQAGFTKVDVHSGASGIKIRVPEGVAARIHTSGGLAGFNINRSRFPNNISPDYDTAANKVEIRVETGVGGVDIL